VSPTGSQESQVCIGVTASFLSMLTPPYSCCGSLLRRNGISFSLPSASFFLQRAEQGPLTLSNNRAIYKCNKYPKRYLREFGIPLTLSKGKYNDNEKNFRNKKLVEKYDG